MVRPSNTWRYIFFRKRKVSDLCNHAQSILPYDSRPIPRPEKQATSPAFPGRRISRTDGPDLAFPGHFANKSSDFIEINPRSNILSQKILQKNPKYFSKSTRGPTSSLSSFCKKNPNFSRIQPAVQAFLGWLATRSVGLSGPNSARCWFVLSIILFQLRINLLKLWNYAANHRKNHK